METEKQNICENNGESVDIPCSKKKKAGKILLKIAVSAFLIALFLLFLYLLFYSYENDGADWLRKVA